MHTQNIPEAKLAGLHLWRCFFSPMGTEKLSQVATRHHDRSDGKEWLG